MNHNAIAEVAKKLQTRDGVTQAIETFTNAARIVADLPMEAEAKAALLNSAEQTRETLVELAEKLRTGDYIVVDPDLSGWRYVTCYYPEGGMKEKVNGHDKLAGVIALAERTGLPVVVGSEHPEAWREQTARRIRKAGIVAITEMGGRN